MMKVFLFLFLLPVILPVEGRPLKMVSYNIHHGEGMDGKVDLKRIAELIAKEKPDLVALQEVDCRCERSGGVDQAAVLGELLKMDHRFGKFMDFQGGEYGMAVLSRFPIEKTMVHELPRGAEPRCALEIVVKPEGWGTAVSFVGIHHDWTEEKFRVAQVKGLIEGVGERGHPVFLAGDFNEEPGGGSLGLLKDSGWVMLRKKPAKTWPAVEPTQEIDFFFAIGLEAVEFDDRVLEEKVASDHRPIAVKVSVSSKEAKP
ncbi:MAG: endonuclease/exonuclease/phosphatase family protein [Verrucomicrobiaceae bacterium]